MQLAALKWTCSQAINLINAQLPFCSICLVCVWGQHTAHICLLLYMYVSKSFPLVILFSAPLLPTSMGNIHSPQNKIKKLLQMRNIWCFKVHREGAVFPTCTADVAAECMCTRRLQMNSPHNHDNYTLQYVLFQINSGSSKEGEKKIVILFF